MATTRTDSPIELASCRLGPVGQFPPPQIHLFRSEATRDSSIFGKFASKIIVETSLEVAARSQPAAARRPGFRASPHHRRRDPETTRCAADRVLPSTEPIAILMVRQGTIGEATVAHA